MEQTFLTGISIENVRHLSNILIPLDKNIRKHLILTGKNGSGKTSVVEAVVKYIQNFLGEYDTPLDHVKMMYERSLKEINKFNLLEDSEENRKNIFHAKEIFNLWKRKLGRLDSGVILSSTSNAMLKEKYQNGNFIFAYSYNTYNRGCYNYVKIVQKKLPARRWIKFGVLPSFLPIASVVIYDIYLGYTIKI